MTSRVGDPPFVAFDGTNYWTANGNNNVTANMAEFDASGNFVADMRPSTLHHPRSHREHSRFLTGFAKLDSGVK